MSAQAVQAIETAGVSTWLFAVVVVILGIAVITLIVTLAVLMYRQRAQLTPEDAQRVILKAEERAESIVAEAVAEARELRTSIERDRMRALTEDQQSVERFLDAYRHQLDASIKELSYGVEKEHMRATTHFVEALQNIEQRVALNANEAKHSMDSFTGQSSQLFERLSLEIENVEKGIQHLALALEEAAANESDKNAEIVRDEMRKIGEETAKSVVKVAKGLDEALQVNLEKEFTAITHELGKYREARMRLVNERILLLLEETAQIALQKKLSLKDQADLVYRSLEEAKQRGIFV